MEIIPKKQGSNKFLLLFFVIFALGCNAQEKDRKFQEVDSRLGEQIDSVMKNRYFLYTPIKKIIINEDFFYLSSLTSKLMKENYLIWDSVRLLLEDHHYKVSNNNIHDLNFLEEWNKIILSLQNDSIKYKLFSWDLSRVISVIKHEEEFNGKNELILKLSHFERELNSQKLYAIIYDYTGGDHWNITGDNIFVEFEHDYDKIKEVVIFNKKKFTYLKPRWW